MLVCEVNNVCNWNRHNPGIHARTLSYFFFAARVVWTHACFHLFIFLSLLANGLRISGRVAAASGLERVNNINIYVASL